MARRIFLRKNYLPWARNARLLEYLRFSHRDESTVLVSSEDD